MEVVVVKVCEPPNFGLNAVPSLGDGAEVRHEEELQRQVGPELDATKQEADELLVWPVPERRANEVRVEVHGDSREPEGEPATVPDEASGTLKELVLADDKDVVLLNGLAEAERGDRVGDLRTEGPSEAMATMLECSMYNQSRIRRSASGSRMSAYDKGWYNETG